MLLAMEDVEIPFGKEISDRCKDSLAVRTLYEEYDFDQNGKSSSSTSSVSSSTSSSEVTFSTFL